MSVKKSSIPLVIKSNEIVATDKTDEKLFADNILIRIAMHFLLVMV
jgi:hypothetical protein